MKLFRERLLARLVEHHAISEDLARKLVAWRHPDFSSHIAEAILFENKVVASITDSLAIRRILDHLDLSPPEKPPPDTREVVRVPVDEEGREIEDQPA